MARVRASVSISLVTSQPFRAAPYIDNAASLAWRQRRDIAKAVDEADDEDDDDVASSVTRRPSPVTRLPSGSSASVAPVFLMPIYLWCGTSFYALKCSETNWARNAIKVTTMRTTRTRARTELARSRARHRAELHKKPSEWRVPGSNRIANRLT